MVRAVEVFTPTDVPTITYVERTTKNFESELINAFAIPKMIVSISGPSKSGKTTLVTKVINPEFLIHIYGVSIKHPDDLWRNVIAWMGGPIQRTKSKSGTIIQGATAAIGAKGGVPFVVEGNVEFHGDIKKEHMNSVSETYAPVNVDDIAREIGSSDYVVFIDDFHYIQKEVRDEIGKQIKAATERGIRICTASVPHRSDDVVRSNAELRGRVTAVDMSYWSREELRQIAILGFKELNVVVDDNIIDVLAEEAVGSPQLMQAICLHFCFQLLISETCKSIRQIHASDVKYEDIFEKASVMSDFSTMVNTLHAGPKLRGTERKIFSFYDGSQGDVYRCVLLAIRSEPARLSFRYDEMLRRTREICKSDSPVGSSVSESLLQMDKLAKTIQDAPVIEWDEDVLDIVEPYFLFYLRSSSHLKRLAND